MGRTSTAKDFSTQQKEVLELLRLLAERVAKTVEATEKGEFTLEEAKHLLARSVATAFVDVMEATGLAPEGKFNVS